MSKPKKKKNERKKGSTGMIYWAVIGADHN